MPLRVYNYPGGPGTVLAFTPNMADRLACELMARIDDLIPDEDEDEDEDTCTHCGDDTPDEADDRSLHEHMADIAAATLARLQELHGELVHLEDQLDMLADWAVEQHQLADRGEFLTNIAVSISKLGCCVPEAVRDIASTLPVRGLDYGEDR